MDGKLRNMTSLYLTKENNVLLLYRVGSRVVNNKYIATAGGHFENIELNNAKACVLRELYEETRLEERDINNLSLRYITLRLKNNEIRQNYFFFAEINDKIKKIKSNEGLLYQVGFNDVLSLEMPFSAKQVLEHYINVGKDTDYLYCGTAARDGVIFSIMEEF